MAYGTKYRGEFKDIMGLLWRIDIDYDGFSGPITTLLLTDNPLTIELLNNGDDWYTKPIHGSTATIELFDETGFQFLPLYDYANLTYRVSIYHGDAYELFWRGFINSEGYKENYDGTGYALSLQASDGMGLLKNKPFKYTITTEDDTYYDGRLSEAYIINEILNKINITSFTEFINVYESELSSGTGDSVFTQIFLDADVFKDKTCYDVLEGILTKYGAIILQDRGMIYITRPEELFQTTVYGRIFTSATAFTSTSITPEQWMNRTAHLNNLLQPEGGVLSIIPPVKKVTINQDYGYKTSWINNYSFDPDTYDDATYSFQGWDRNGGAGYQRRASYVIAGEKEGVAFLPTSTVPDTVNNISQEFGLHAIKSSDAFKFAISYKLVNTNNSSNGSVPIYIKIHNGPFDATPTRWLKINTSGDSFLTWANALSYITWNEADVVPGEGEWLTKEWSFASLPTTGEYTITLYSSETNIMLLIKEVKFITTNNTIKVTKKRKVKIKANKWYNWLTGITGRATITNPYVYKFNEIDNDEIVEKEYSITNAIKGTEVKNDYDIGDVIDSSVDNVIEQFQGAMGLKSLIVSAAKFVADNAAAYLTGGVELTSTLNNIYFESTVAGTDFTGSTTITNTTGDLSGAITNLVANANPAHQITDITMSGTSGTNEISIEDLSLLADMTFSSSISNSINNFISTNQTSWSLAGFTLSHPSTNVLRLTNTIDYSDHPVSSTLLTGNLSGSVAYYQTPTTGAQRKDQITLSGTYGTANILCDGTTKEISFDDAIYFTNGIWNTRQYNNEAKPLLSILGDSIRKQYNRPIHLLEIPLLERNYTTNIPQLRLIYNLRDSVNIDAVTGEARYFMINGAEFNVRDREYDLSLVEIVTSESDYIYDANDLTNTTNLK